MNHRYLAQRLAALLATLFAVSLLVFSIVRFIPGDPAAIIAGTDAMPEDVELVRKSLGLDQPVHVQYWRFLSRAVQGDLGRSLRSYRPVATDLAERFPVSLYLASISLGLSLVVGVPLGLVTALRRGKPDDSVFMVLSVLGVSMPPFWLGLLLMNLFSVRLGWLPTSGFEGAEYVVLPAVTLAAFSLANIVRTTRSSMLDVLQHDYVRTARAKGLSEILVKAKHALKNAAIPLLAVVGLQFGYLLGSSVITETVFAWPGLGLLLVDAILHRDLPTVQGAVLLIAAVFAVVNLAVDLCYGLLDPRIRFG